jgi:hypothetical protein
VRYAEATTLDDLSEPVLAAWRDQIVNRADGNHQQMLLSRLVDNGYPVKTVRQGWSWSAATREVERVGFRQMSGAELVVPGTETSNSFLTGATSSRE